ncbi:hypothetical protein QOZ80_6BG0460260 [Eleusine coracana subsp. coracana]|nr:hypothetical protein QOZ80_6BG0460260 [Eleusine coracana subsp. coracana]
MSKEEIRPVRATIDEVYSRVNLDENESSSHTAFCFGLLDPTSNLIVNTAITAASSTIAAPSPPHAEGNHDGEDMIKRSLDGLVAFLAYLFPYLPKAEATLYLAAANADPLAAALLIIDRRRIRKFNFCSGATMVAVETTLRYAAVASKHPDPHQLVTGWKLLSPHLKSLVSELSIISSATEHDAIAIVSRTLALATTTTNKLTSSSNTDDLVQLEQSWELASSRCVSPKPESLPPVRGAMKRMLLSTIHGFYLQALAMMPTAELRSRYHRSLLMGGYCYGPLDPVSNIIVNTIWYDETFPTSKEAVTLNMVSTDSLWRLVSRSFYGLISFLCTRYPDITPDQALHRLHASGAKLHVADHPDLIYGTHDDDDASVAEAYFAAATAAFHTNPLVQQEFLGSAGALPKLKLASEALKDGRQLTSEDLEFIAMLLCCSSTGSSFNRQQEAPPEKIKKWFFPKPTEYVHSFWEQHERVSKRVNAALHTYNKNRVQRYELHIICGVNELVSGPELCLGMFSNPRTFIFHHSHINFLATCEGGPPTLFFAECCNHDADDSSWCVPILPHRDAVRCIYCEDEGDRILHPAMKSFHGRGIEFERVLRGESPGTPCGNHYTNDLLVQGGSTNFVDSVYDVPDDYIYKNFCIDESDDGTQEDWFRAMMPQQCC